jgi:hypothetical protein
VGAGSVRKAALGRLGIDGLFVTDSIHAEEVGSREKSPSADTLAGMFATAGGTPQAVTSRLAW